MVASLLCCERESPQTMMALNSAEISTRVFPLVSGRMKKVKTAPSRHTQAKNTKQ